MKLGLIAGYAGRKVRIPIDAIKHAERLGYDSVWTSEAYGSDAVTPTASARNPYSSAEILPRSKASTTSSKEPGT